MSDENTQTPEGGSTPAAEPAAVPGNMSLGDLARQFAITAAGSGQGEPATAGAQDQTPAPIEPAPEAGLDQAGLAPEPQSQEPAPAEDGDLPVDADDSPGIKSLIKRVNTLTRRLRETEAENAKLKAPAEGQKPEPEKVPALPPPTFGNVPEVAELDRKIGLARTMLTWAEQNPQGGDFLDPGTGESLGSFTQEQAQNMRLNALRQLPELEATKAVTVAELRRQDARERQAYMAQARQVYPWIGNPESAEFQQAIEVLQLNPQLLQRSDYHLIVGDYVEGRRAREARARAAGNGHAAPRPPGTRPTPVPVGRGSSAPRGTRESGAKAQLAAAEAAFEKSGRMEDLQAVLRLRAQARAAG